MKVRVGKDGRKRKSELSSTDKAACRVGFGQPGASQVAGLGKEGRPGLTSDPV